MKSLQKRSDSHNKILLEIQSDALLIISCICENDNHRKVSTTYMSICPSICPFIQELFGGYEGVPVIIKYLKQDVNKFFSERLFLAAADCTWYEVTVEICIH